MMGIEEPEDRIRVTTADTDVVRSIGELLHHAYHGAFAFRYTKEGNILRGR